MLKVGLILYSVRDMMAEDPMGTIEAVAKLGYKNIEVCNHNAAEDNGCGFGLEAADMKAKFDEYGSKVISAHIDPFEKADLPKVIEYEQVLGNKNIVYPMGNFADYDDLMQHIELFNKAGKTLAENGMRLLYHNHFHEFRTYKGKRVLDYIAENTDPDYVGLELDTFWTMRAGEDPIGILKHFGSRIKLVHQKDFAIDAMIPINLNGIVPEDYEQKEGEPLADFFAGLMKAVPAGAGSREAAMRITSSAFTEIGKGIMPIQKIIDTAAEYTDAEYIILEQDYTRMPTQIDSVACSMESFRQFNNISWEN